MNKIARKEKITEKVEDLMGELVDALVNTMEFYETPQEFVSFLGDLGVDRVTAKKIFDAYWKVGAMDRFNWDYPEWSKWLKTNFGIREEVIKEDKMIIEITEEVVINQEDKDIILEKGDKIEIIKEARNMYIQEIASAILDTLRFEDDRKVIQTIILGIETGFRDANDDLDLLDMEGMLYQVGKDLVARFR